MKYIDAEKLNADLDRWVEAMADAEGDYSDGVRFALRHFRFLLASFQQEQSDFPTSDEQMKEFLATHPKIKVPEKYKNPDWLFKKQEQPEVDFEKEIDNYLDTIQAWQIQEAPFTTMEKCARHFYELGQQEMRHRITNPEYNAKVVEQLKSEYPIIKE